jgi:hypothetical protein
MQHKKELIRKLEAGPVTARDKEGRILIVDRVNARWVFFWENEAGIAIETAQKAAELLHHLQQEPRNLRATG